MPHGVARRPLGPYPPERAESWFCDVDMVPVPCRAELLCGTGLRSLAYIRTLHAPLRPWVLRAEAMGLALK